jgi:DNA-binding MarR family transcriptional regulator
MTVAVFDELIHPSTRLSIVAMLASTDWAEFTFVRDRLSLSDSALSKQFATLEEAGYVTIDRPVSNHRRRVRVSLTETGRRAFEGHVAALRAVIASAELARSFEADLDAASPSIDMHRPDRSVRQPSV